MSWKQVRTWSFIETYGGEKILQEVFQYIWEYFWLQQEAVHKEKERLKNYFRQVFSKAFHYLKALTLEVEAINVVHRTPCWITWNWKGENHTLSTFPTGGHGISRVKSYNRERKRSSKSLWHTEDVCLVCFSMRLADRKERFLHAKKEGGQGIGINLSELDFQEPKQFLSRQKRQKWRLIMQQ